MTTSGPTAPPTTKPQTAMRQGLTPPFLADRPFVRVGLLLPFSTTPEESSALYRAAELGLFDFGGQSTLLIPRESGASEADAAANARSLIRDGADILVGPLFRDAVQGAANAAREGGVPLIAFSTDRTVAGGGAYLISLTLEEDVRRIVDYAISRGLKNYALLAPENDYGRRVEVAMRKEVAARGGAFYTSQFYRRNERDAAAAARLLAQQLKTTNVQAVLIADRGPVLRATGPALLIGGMDLSRVKLLGTSAWAGGEADREPTLAGGWYAGPDPALRANFEARYKDVFGRGPPPIASQAYDAMMVASAVAKGGAGAVNRASVERADGFLGADGLLRFKPDGSVERGLAVLEVRPQGPVTLEPAARSMRGS